MQLRTRRLTVLWSLDQGLQLIGHRRLNCAGLMVQGRLVYELAFIMYRVRVAHNSVCVGLSERLRLRLRLRDGDSGVRQGAESWQRKA
jgi:hypothetical protein